MKNIRIIAYTLPFLFLGCKHETQSAQSLPAVTQHAPQVWIAGWDKIKISESGEIFVNQKQIGSAEFAAECQRIKQTSRGVIIYTGEGEHVIKPAQLDAVHQLIGAGVPMKAALRESEID
jgi:hypothetical protein